jgi:hypothetical protein
MDHKKTLLAILVFASAVLSAMNAQASQPLETETARMLRAGNVVMEFTGEFQYSSDGREIALPLAIEYGITNDLLLLVEPVPFTAIIPSTGKRACGLGDVEVTSALRFFKETKFMPDVALAIEIKLPTAHSLLIGTRKTDYTGYFIVSKRFASVAVHLNAGYTVVGRIPGMNIKNTFDFGAAVEYFINKHFDFVGEVVGNTAATSKAEGAESPTAITPEVAGFEVVGMLGMRWHITRELSLCLGITYDNNNAILVRPGLTWKFTL